MTRLQVAEDTWYAVLDENGYPVYYSTDKNLANNVSKTVKGGEVVVMEDLT